MYKQFRRDDVEEDVDELSKELFNPEIVEFIENKTGREWEDIPREQKTNILDSLINEYNQREKSKLDL